MRIDRTSVRQASEYENENCIVRSDLVGIRNDKSIFEKSPSLDGGQTTAIVMGAHKVIQYLLYRARKKLLHPLVVSPSLVSTTKTMPRADQVPAVKMTDVLFGRRNSLMDYRDTKVAAYLLPAPFY